VKRLVIAAGVVVAVFLASSVCTDVAGSTIGVVGSTPTSKLTKPGGSGWDVGAYAYRGLNAQRYQFSCPARGSASTIYGTDIYTDDSSVCTAAVHSGLITLKLGGKVTIEIRPGAKSYTGSTRNGITSESYGSWVGSYVFVTSRVQPSVSAECVQAAALLKQAATLETAANNLKASAEADLAKAQADINSGRDATAVVALAEAVIKNATTDDSQAKSLTRRAESIAQTQHC
jgi:hypothetical protein